MSLVGAGDLIHPTDDDGPRSCRGSHLPPWVFLHSLLILHLLCWRLAHPLWPDSAVPAVATCFWSCLHSSLYRCVDLLFSPLLRDPLSTRRIVGSSDPLSPLCFGSSSPLSTPYSSSRHQSAYFWAHIALSMLPRVPLRVVSAMLAHLHSFVVVSNPLSHAGCGADDVLHFLLQGSQAGHPVLVHNHALRRRPKMCNMRCAL